MVETGWSVERGSENLVTIEWRTMIDSAMLRPPRSVSAMTRIPHPWNDSFARPRLVRCNDGNQYVIKGQQKGGRALVTEQVVARLGAIIGAPVVPVSIVDLPPDLVKDDSELSHMPAGLCHGCRYVPKCTDKAWVRPNDLAPYRASFALLAMLYGWVIPDDHQVIYSTVPPPALYSVDHGHFLPGGPGTWNAGTLAAAPIAAPDARIVNDCQLTQTELEAAVTPLRGVTNESLAEIVAVSPRDWLPSIDDRVALAEYLAARRDTLVSAFPAAA